PDFFSPRSPFLWMMNLFVFGQDLYELMNNIVGEPVRSWFPPHFFDPKAMLIGQAWTLSSEGFFYLLAPFVVRSPARIVAPLVASLGLRITLLGYLGWGWQWGYWFFPCSLSFFLMGALSYHFYKR